MYTHQQKTVKASSVACAESEKQAQDADDLYKKLNKLHDLLLAIYVYNRESHLPGSNLKG